MATVVFKVCALTATLLSTVALAAPTSSSGCGRVHIMCARGTSQAPGVGSIGEVADQIKLYADAAIISAVPYPASQTNPDYLDSVKLGATHLQSMIKSTVDRCPGVRIVLLGYSQGAQVVGDALVGSTEDNSGTSALAPRYADNIKAVVLMGDVAKDYRQTFMKGTGVNKNGMIPRVIHYDISPFTSRIASYCDAADPVCNSGNDWNAHWQYMNKYKVNAARFALSKLGRVGTAQKSYP